MQYLGDFPEDANVYIPFNTFSSDDPQASVTATTLIASDIYVHKDGSVTDIVTDGATIAIDFDGITGNHLITIDTSAHADYSVGSDYVVRIEGATVDAGNINAFVASFSIENRFNEVDVTKWLGTAAATPTTAGVPEVDVTYISGDATAADNLELQYDGTGLAGDTFPATQAAVGAIGVASGSGLPFAMIGDNTGGALKGVTVVGTPTGTYSDTEADDGNYHVMTHAANAIDIVYQVNVGGNRTISEFDYKGYLTSANDTITVQMYDFVGADWETRAEFSGQGGTTDISRNFRALGKHTGTSGADIGCGFIRFVCTGQSSPVLNIDELVAVGVSQGTSVGYANGRIWVDTVNGAAGTEQFVNGVADNPVDTWADALTLSASLGITDFHIINGSTITLSASSVSYSLFGNNWNLALGGQDVSSAYFSGAIVSGTGTSPSAEVEFDHCHMGACTLGAAHITDCGLSSTITASAAEDYTLSHNYSEVAGSGTPIFDFGAAVGNTNLSMRGYSGGIQIDNKDGTGTDQMSLEGNGQLVVSASSGGAISVRGNFLVTNTGGATITYDDNTSSISLIEADTNELQSDDVPTLIAAVQTEVDKIDELTTQGDTNETKIDAVKADTAAIKVPTDKMVFTKANELDANTKSINDAEVVGDGNATPWDGV